MENMIENRLLVLVIFLLTYVFISIQRIPGLKIDRPSGVTIGSTLLLLTGLISLEEAYRFIDLGVITFLLGMMIMIAYLEYAGFFEHVAHALVRISRTSSQLLLATILSSAFLSAFFVNDTICLLVTPILLRATRYLKLNPVPYLIAVATASNIGSGLTVTGNPQNMYIGIQSGVRFLSFMKIMLVPVVLGLAILYGVIRLVYRREVNGSRLAPVRLELPPLRGSLVARTLGALCLTLILFLAGLDYPLAALVGACVILLAAYIPPREVLRNVDWTVLLFFAGLFIVMGAFEKAGYMDDFTDFAQRVFREPTLGSSLGLAGATALISNLVSNVPAVILMQPLIQNLGGSESLWVLLAMASTFAGNLTLVGSVANLIVVEKAQAEGVHLGFFRYLVVGVPVTLATLLVGTLWLWWVGL